MNNRQMEEIIRQILVEYPNIYNEAEYNYLKSVNLDDVKPEYTIDILRQILENYNYYKEEDSVYDYFINHLQEEDKLERNIIEVGGGIIPSLGKKISLRQNTGTITIYDPKLSNFYKPTNNFRLKKTKFTSDTKIKKANLLIGFMPCEATEKIITAAAKQNKDFVVAMCEGGPHGDIYDYFEDEQEWLDSMLSYTERLVEDNGMGKLKILEMPKKFGIPYPIIENKR